MTGRTREAHGEWEGQQAGNGESMEEKERLRRMYEARVRSYPDAPEGYAEAWEGWCRMLLTQGGDLVVPHLSPEENLEELLRGAETLGRNVEWREGAPSRCHENAAHLWIRGEVEGIGTGYALSDDGLWRQHTWGVTGETVTETTAPRERYVGVRLEGVDALKFAARNAPTHLEAELLSGRQRGAELQALLRELLQERRQQCGRSTPQGTE